MFATVDKETAVAAEPEEKRAFEFKFTTSSHLKVGEIFFWTSRMKDESYIPLVRLTEEMEKGIYNDAAARAFIIKFGWVVTERLHRSGNLQLKVRSVTNPLLTKVLTGNHNVITSGKIVTPKTEAEA